MIRRLLLFLWLVAGAYDTVSATAPGSGKRIVLISGDEEYRSEQALPQLAKILTVRHGFECTVLFAIDAKDGTINPDQRDNIPGLEALDHADLMVIFTRFRDLPDAQMRHIVDYVESGRPIVALRTATHAFDLTTSKTYQRYSWNSKEWDGGFGRQVLGETWIDHHGEHGKQSTRGIVVEDQRDHPILRGIRSGDIWVPTDAYKVRLPLPGDSRPLILGQVLQGMQPSDPPVTGGKNEPMMPVAWTKTYGGKSRSRVFATTMGAAVDLENETLRRLIVNACFWAMGLESQILPRTNVDLVGYYKPLPFGFGGFARGLKPADLLAHRPDQTRCAPNSADQIRLRISGGIGGGSQCRYISMVLRIVRSTQAQLEQRCKCSSHHLGIGPPASSSRK